MTPDETRAARRKQVGPMTKHRNDILVWLFIISMTICAGLLPVPWGFLCAPVTLLGVIFIMRNQP